MKTVGTVLLFVWGVSMMTACKPAECQQLVDCCAAVQDNERVGKSCGGLANGVSDPQKCQSITQTVGFMLESKGQEVPPACRVEAKSDR